MARLAERKRVKLITHLTRELEGVDRFLRDMEASKGAVPENWRRGMLRYYRTRRKEIGRELSTLNRERKTQATDK